MIGTLRKVAVSLAHLPVTTGVRADATASNAGSGLQESIRNLAIRDQEIGCSGDNEPRLQATTISAPINH